MARGGRASGASGGATTGAAAGAMVGSAVPVIGTAAGAGAGAIIGGVGGYIGGYFEDKDEEAKEKYQRWLDSQQMAFEQEKWKLQKQKLLRELMEGRRADQAHYASLYTPGMGGGQ